MLDCLENVARVSIARVLVDDACVADGAIGSNRELDPYVVRLSIYSRHLLWDIGDDLRCRIVDAERNVQRSGGGIRQIPSMSARSCSSEAASPQIGKQQIVIAKAIASRNE
jgi:hypothetical protein